MEIVLRLLEGMNWISADHFSGISDEFCENLRKFCLQHHNIVIQAYFGLGIGDPKPTNPVYDIRFNS